MNIERVILIKPVDVELARSASAILSPIHGVGMFTTPVYNEVGEIVHYISSGWIDSQVISYMTDPVALYSITNSFATLAECESLINNGILSTDDPHSLLNSLGLTLNPPDNF